jgi:hypothetical protein
MPKRVLKVLHELGAIGVMGSLAACIVLIATAPTQSPVAYAAVRQGIAALAKWLLVPSLALMLVSGLLAIAINKAYHEAGWAWVKALLGIGMFEGTLLTVGGSARRAAELSAIAATGLGPDGRGPAGQADAAELARILRTEWGGLWLLLGLCFVNVVLAVWRPRLGRRSPLRDTDETV